MTPKLLTPILLPTSEASNLYIQNGKLCYDETIVKSAKNCGDHHLYLTSEASIKEGDWAMHNGVPKKAVSKEIVAFANEQKCPKIEFTTDSKLWDVELPSGLHTGGVPAIDENTKALISWYNAMRKEDDTKEVLFLTEFCKRWNENKKNGVYFPNSLSKGDEMCYECGKIKCICNQKDNHKVDVEKLAEEYRKRNEVHGLTCDKEIATAFSAGFTYQSLQSSAGGFSLEDMRKAFQYYSERPIVDKQFLNEDFDEFIFSLTSSSPSGSLRIDLIEGMLTFK